MRIAWSLMPIKRSKHKLLFSSGAKKSLFSGFTVAQIDELKSLVSREIKKKKMTGDAWIKFVKDIEHIVRIYKIEVDRLENQSKNKINLALVRKQIKTLIKLVNNQKLFVDKLLTMEKKVNDLNTIVLEMIVRKTGIDNFANHTWAPREIKAELTLILSELPTSEPANAPTRPNQYLVKNIVSLYKTELDRNFTAGRENLHHEQKVVGTIIPFITKLFEFIGVGISQNYLLNLIIKNRNR